MMMGSREAVVDYMTPLGLHHLMDTGHHYGPAPWVERSAIAPTGTRPTTTAPTRNGIGFDRGPERQQRRRAVRAEGRARSFADLDARCRSSSCSGSTTCRGTTRPRPGASLWDELVVPLHARRRGS